MNQPAYIAIASLKPGDEIYANDGFPFEVVPICQATKTMWDVEIKTGWDTTFQQQVKRMKGTTKVFASRRQS